MPIDTDLDTAELLGRTHYIRRDKRKTSTPAERGNHACPAPNSSRITRPVVSSSRAVPALEPVERLLDAMQMGMFTADHPLIFRTLQRALVLLPGFED